ncbi:MAG: polyprenyl synthetase family protein, partial [Leptotrichiaceae bacterium]|nr:polyprenyl synthetase family protein [Leptotrichiaceae bacterium]
MLKEYLNEKKVIIETNLQEKLALYKNPSMLSEAMNYSVMNGGKRLRPIIMYMMCDLFNKNYDEIQDVAIALEFIHCYSLVHDDLPAMDNDMYRRGKLTTHIKFDEATA